MLSAMYWLCLPVARVGGLPWPLALLCAVFITLCLSLQGGVFSAFAYFARNYGFWLLPPLLALAWYLLEYIFALVMGVPWLPLAGALAQMPLLLQPAAIFGAYFTGALWLLVVFYFFPIRPAPRFARTLAKIVACALASCLLWQGIYAMFIDEADKSAPLAHALIVEGNVDQNQKWTPPFQARSLEIYSRLTNEGLKQARAAGVENPLIIWPETAMPFFYERNFHLGELLRHNVAQWGCPLLFGAPGADPAGRDDYVYNRAFLLGPAGQPLGYYDKMHLVPFGESLPDWLRFDFLEALLQGVGVYKEGQSIESLDYGKLALGALICYEGIFPWLAKDRIAGGANILVDISNDGWFGRSPAAQQHLYLTIPRCIEENRWLWRATNTGISAVIDNRGRILEVGGTFREGTMLFQGRLIAERSLYYYLSDWLAWIAALLFIAGAIFGWKRAGRPG